MTTLSGTDRMRFNDGFWDGLHAQAKPSMITTFEGIRAALAGKFTYDPIWAEGVCAGYHHHGDRPATSDAAWHERQDARKAQATERKRLREARPARVTRY